MKLSVLLIGYNSWHFLEANLKSLSFLKDNPDSEIIYVDNASADFTVRNIQLHFPFVKIFRNQKNEGVAKARNYGLKATSGDYIWILDSDTVVTQEALNAMIAFMEENQNVGICGCKMYGQDGSTQDSCREFPTIKGKLNAAKDILLKKLHLNPAKASSSFYDKNQSEPFEVDYIIGACQIIRREAFEKVGFLDENIFYGPEDADYCLRMKQAGYQVYYLPQISIYHAYQRISSHKVFSKINRKHIQGLLYYFWKHR